MKVKDILPSVKANKHTYYNLDGKSIIMFKDLYSYLVRHKEKEVGGVLIKPQLNTINIKYTALTLLVFGFKKKQVTSV